MREFNRSYTEVLGLLQEGLLDTPHSLTEARVLFELAQEETTALAELRRRLGLDAGYATRILARFEGEGLIRRERSTADRRRQMIRLTPQGRAAFALLDSRSAVEVAALLGRLSESEQRRLLAAMSTIKSLVSRRSSSAPPELRAPAAGDLGWVVERHGALYADEYGWDERFEALVARVVAEYAEHRDPDRERSWIAEVDDRRVGCVFCVKRTERTAQLRLLLVEPWARGAGLGTRLVDECVRFARAARFVELMLWTNDVLASARRIYQRAGFELGEEETHESFGRPVVGQTWSLRL